MLVSGYLGAVLIGALVGLLGRLILPGRQRIGVFATFVIGVGSAVLGTVVARALNIDDGANVQVWVLRWDWVVLAIQVGLAIIAVALANMLTFTRLAGGDDTPRRRVRRSKAKRES
ncbi:GlsB/YeaQ/YmgE family stress response membrane protein [Micromonospora sp. NPDC005553]|uniref:GlsB/YeaQ/YmgE family stress response membrane protein n=1 Tax=Micromonospora sp. NPDC005553 TaxID=3364232 RepID=UPI003694DCF4